MNPALIPIIFTTVPLAFLGITGIVAWRQYKTPPPPEISEEATRDAPDPNISNDAIPLEPLGFNSQSQVEAAYNMEAAMKAYGF